MERLNNDDAAARRAAIERCPSGWGEVTVGTFQELSAVPPGDDWTDRFVGTAAVLCDADPAWLEEWPLEDARELFSRMSWAYMPAPQAYVTSFSIDGRTFRFDDRLRGITLGQWADIEGYCEDGRAVENLHLIAAILYAEDGVPYSVDAVMERAALFRERATVADVYGSLLFFSLIAIEYTSSTMGYSFLGEVERAARRTTA